VVWNVGIRQVTRNRIVGHTGCRSHVHLIALRRHPLERRSTSTMVSCRRWCAGYRDERIYLPRFG
jgi:hypothetical protein